MNGPRIESRSRASGRRLASGGRWIGAGALAVVVIATFGAPRAARAADPLSARPGYEAPDGPVSAAALPVFTCRLSHAVASTALGVFATSLTLWTHVSDADPAHVAAVVWLDPSIVGAVYGLDVAAASSVTALIAARP